MTPRELLDRALAAINAGDVDALLALYHPEVEYLGRDRVLRGPEGMRPDFTAWLARGPHVRALSCTESADTLLWEIESDAGRGHGTIVVRDGLIWRETVGFVAGGQERAPAPNVRVELEPYTAWEPRPVADPRTAGADARMPVLMEIVAAEGPMLAKRAFALYTRASGGKKTTTAVKAPLAGAAWRLKIQDRLAIGREGATTIDDDDVLRVAGSPPVHVRELGPRTLEEVPLD